MGMEARVSHLAIGALMLLLVCSISALLVWSSKSTEQNPAEHYIRFAGSVAGLDVGSSVLLGGIPIGRVTSVRTDPQDTSLARVDISVNGAAPIYSGSKATMELQGISGNVLVDISRGGRMHDRRLRPGEEIAAVADHILANIEKLRIQIATETPAFNSIVAESNDAAVQIRRAWEEFQQESRSIDPLKAAAKAAQKETQDLTSNFSGIETNLSQFIEDNRQPIHDFSSSGYSQISPMISELHQLGRNLERLWTEVRQDPARFFLTDREQQGFVPPPSTSRHH
jgi:phospholipid/cholesterol/gamma-HCH transport system substrate-binding protein